MVKGLSDQQRGEEKSREEQRKPSRRWSSEVRKRTTLLEVEDSRGGGDRNNRPSVLMVTFRLPRVFSSNKFS